MHRYCRNGTYNQRRISTLENETSLNVFGEIGATKLQSLVAPKPLKLADIWLLELNLCTFIRIRTPKWGYQSDFIMKKYHEKLDENSLT